MLLPERAPTANELKKWETIIRRLDRAKRWLVVNYLLKQNLGVLQEFCEQNDLTVPVTPSNIAVLLTERAAQLQTIQKAIQAVERLELGVQFKFGDIDIVAPTWYTEEQTQEYNLGFWPIVLAGVAVVLIIGLSARLITIEEDLETCAKQNKKLITAGDKALCSDPTDPRCAEWKKTKQETEFIRTESTIDQITGGLKKFGSAATGGIGIGLAVAIPLLAWSWFKK